MYDNIGEKIKNFAKVSCCLCMIASVVAFISLLAAKRYGVAFLVLLGGCVISWVGSFFAYGFGQLIENTDILVDKVRYNKNPYIPEKNTDRNNDFSGLKHLRRDTPDKWVCKVCNTENKADALYCEDCGFSVADNMTYKESKEKCSEWACSNCGNIWSGDVYICTCGEERKR